MLHVASLSIFPVKSLRGCAVGSAAVEPWGLAGDRRFLVVDDAGRFLTQREVPQMATITARAEPDGLTLAQDGRASLRCAVSGADADPLTVTVWQDRVVARPVGQGADSWLSAALGRVCRLVYMDEPATARPVDPIFAGPGDRVSFADGFPLLLASLASLDDLNRRLADPVPMDRFRPNVVLAGSSAWAEDGWRSVRIGAVPFDVVKPCARCIMITTDQQSGERHGGVEPIRTLQGFRRDVKGQVIFGQNLIPRATGTITAGDAVTAYQ